MKTQMSRFHIHDDLTAPEGSLPVLKGALASGGQLPNFLGVLAGSPAALRGYTRFRAELRHGRLTLRDARAHRARRRRALPLPARASPSTSARRAGPASASTRSPAPASGTRATRARPRCCATSSALLEQRGHAPMHLHEEAREAGWSDEELLEAIAYVSLESFTAMVNVAGEVPVDGSVEEARVLRAA